MAFDTSLKYAILGIARSGIAAAYKIKELGGDVFLSDSVPVDRVANSAELVQDFECEFGGHSKRLFDCACWIVSPGIPLDIEILNKARAKGIELISEIEFGYRIKAPDSRIIAVTGSNGKSTTASLIHHLLQSLGKNSILAGNIGAAFCSFPIHLPGIEYIVLEISSFQLDLIQSFAPQVAILLNLSPDHLNRYPSYEAYCLSKMRIFENQSAADYAIYFRDSEQTLKLLPDLAAQQLCFSMDNPLADAYLKGKEIIIGQERLNTDKLIIKGPHNYQNLIAALLAIKAIGGNLKKAVDACYTFKGLSHRLEYVDTIRGVKFYNDSKATNCDSVKSALNSFEVPIRIIMGGSDKGEDFGQLTPLLKQKAQKVYITGATLSRMQEAWEGKLDLALEPDFDAAVKLAFAEALPGESIVLSPACASFDRFQNFEERGEYFKDLVRELKA
ncbi:MAG: UDP-N-acetylmuramoyl-L-alanine--D-glutamate ligase [Candidatus Cloacimonetes bacterium]|nr:UDP-N-acetylmuramoyl-L-alanine--D-glutamate ligase [Candidatus Cloacimonadota bacterium]